MLRLPALLLPPLLTVAGSHGRLDLRPTPLPYTDITAESRYALPVQILTQQGVIAGYPDGTVRVERTLNRAEFLKIVILSAGRDSETPKVGRRHVACFPDVTADAWFAPYVCTAKADGIVAGYPDGLFRPDREVNLAEALKVLVRLYSHAAPLREDDQWYFPYFRTTRNLGITVDPRVTPEKAITRGTMAELAAQFLVEDLGQLQRYHEALLERLAMQTREEVDEATTRERGRAQDTTEEVEPAPPLQHEERGTRNEETPLLPPHFSDLAMSRLLFVRGESPPIAGVTVFSEDEPLYLHEVEVELKDETDSINYLQVYLGSGELLGRAVRRRKPNLPDVFYRLDVPPDLVPIIPKAENVRIVVTAFLKEADQGFRAGEFFEVEDIEVTVIGGWTNRNQTKSSSTIDHPRHQVALALLDDIVNAGAAEGVLGSGNDRALGSFLVDASRVDPRAKASLEHLTLTLSKTSDVTVTSLSLGADGTAIRHACTVTGDVVQCLAIPSEIGSLDPPRTLTLYGDVTVTPLAPAPRLSVVIGDPGNPSAPGSVRWTDGTYHYTWVEEEDPVAEGTVWK